MSYIISFFAALNRPMIGQVLTQHDAHATREESLGSLSTWRILGPLT